MASNCPHFSSAVGHLTPRDFDQLISNPRCDICHHDRSNLWLCLYPDCYMLGCSEPKKDHSTKHFQHYAEHVIQFNIDSKRIWCYLCANEVVLLRDSKAWRQFGKILKPGDGSPYVAKPEDQAQALDAIQNPCGLVGLSNLGNTCYMNAALQCLSNTPALTEFFRSCPSLVTHSDRSSHLSKSYFKLVSDIWRRHPPANYMAPTGVLHAIKQAHPMFRGFHQHDSQEFLRCFMDQMHEELMEPAQDGLGQEEDDDNLDSVSDFDDSNSPAMSEQGDEYETADSGVSENSSTVDSTVPDEGDERTITIQPRKRKHDADSAIDSGGSIQSSIAGGDRKREREDADPSDVELGFADAASDAAVSSRSASPPHRPAFRICPKSPVKAVAPFVHGPSMRKRKPKLYRSIISDIFDGKLVSSVQCLTCDRVSTTTETFQDLSLPIPTQETLSALRSQSMKPSATVGEAAANEGWMSWAWSWLTSWIYGPNVSLNDCLAYFFSADELKGDNMYSCEKCKKLRNGLKYSRVTVLPDTLCIHLKRFRHEFAFSSKISSRVTFPLCDLDMAPWLHKDCVSKESTYDLTGVICHHGSAGGGHYTAYALNPDNLEWYEFDDSCVTRVDPSCVQNAEAYVLFYRKNNDNIVNLRREVQELMHLAQEQPSLVQFYVSKQWFNKLNNFAEPGPIDNSDFLCRHGGVLPTKSSFVHELCVTLSQNVWEHLHSRFGGGPVCTRLYECVQCRQELDAMTRQKNFELEEFKQLHAEFKDTDSPGSMYCISSSWFKVWEGFVTGRVRDPPGPIDNKAIITSRAGIQTIRPGSDYLQISHEIWLLFHSIYGGGPEVVVRPTGIVVSSPRGPSLPAITTRLRARSASESSVATSRYGPTTRSRSKSDLVEETPKSEEEENE